MARPGPALVLGHGASGSAATMAPHVAGLRARGIDARAIDLPKGRAERASPGVRVSRSAAEPGIAVGGHSFGGRVASLAAADACDAGRPPLALVLLSYPLHPPGRPDDWDTRSAHWPRITCPVILLSGTSDPFATPALLERAVAERLPCGRAGDLPEAGARPGPGAGRRPGPGRGLRASRRSDDGRRRDDRSSRVVSPLGFEPRTQGLKVPRSATELRAHVPATIAGGVPVARTVRHRRLQPGTMAAIRGLAGRMGR